ncbi:MAG: AI-2E family transporter [Gemmataceae bacterium]
MSNSSTTKPRDTLLILCGLVLVTACLYWARQVLIPVSLALLLTFILTPSVAGLQRRGLGRIPSVLLVVLLALTLLGGVGYLISRQIDNLIGNLPQYRANILAKVQSIRGAGQGKFLGFFQDISDELTQNENRQEKKKLEKKLTRQKAIQAKEGQREPEEDEAGTEKDRLKEKVNEEVLKAGSTPSNPLYVQMDSSGWSGAIEAIGPAAEGLGQVFLVLVLVVFMLIQRENLRNRLVRLIGHGRIIVTTQALDEGAQRISRFLLMQLAINTIFGVALAVGLLLIGLFTGHRELWQYALLWGFLSIVLRFVPYIGTWIVAAMLTGFNVATLPGWTLPVAILGFFLVLELLTANVLEPLLFGHSTGVSPLALLLSAAFWTWLWGPVGLILATPLTVILVVLGKYVPELHFFEVLMGDADALSTDVTFYQRLVAGDVDEATNLVEDYGSNRAPEAIYEEVLLPALLHAKRDNERGELEAEDYAFVLEGIRDTEEDLAAARTVQVEEARGANKAIAIGCPGRDEADELALAMLAQMVRLSGYTLEVVSAEKLTAEVVTHLQQEVPAVVVVGSLPPGGLAQVRYLCKRLRKQSATIKILIGRWGDDAKNERIHQRLLSAGADQVAMTLQDSRAQLIPLLQTAANAAPPDPCKSELLRGTNKMGERGASAP